MSEGITAEQFKVLSELRKEATEIVVGEYVDLLKDNTFTVLEVKHDAPCQHYCIIFKLNGQKHVVEIGADESTVVMQKRKRPAYQVFTHVKNIIAEKLARVFLEETL
ncbi:hypothetical protein LCGC14_0360150 [marine sediment metagenome]|uniref:Uncharacterized protein n=1 Tax=marine sediment metagenome TaxID=412755 RepID=A0A0F9VVJ5_9ZZZZ